MTSIFSPRRTKSSKGGVEALPEVPATLATAHAAAFVKVRRPAPPRPPARRSPLSRQSATATCS